MNKSDTQVLNRLNVVIMPIHTKWLDLIIDRKKTIEVRKRNVREGINSILFYECKTGLITAYAHIFGTYWISRTHHFIDGTLENACLSNQEFWDYAGSDREVCCLALDNVYRIEPAITLADVGLTRAPQSYVYRHVELKGEQI